MERRLKVLITLMGMMLSRRCGLRRILVLGAFEDVLGIGLSVAAPLVLKQLVDALPHPLETWRLATLIAIFVIAWTSPSLLAALKISHTTSMVQALSSRLTGAVLSRQLPSLARLSQTDSGWRLGLLERLPYALQLIIDGLIWRAIPLLLQTAASFAVLTTTLRPRYVLLLGAAFAAYLLLADLGARAFGRGVDAAHRSTNALSARIGDLLRNADRVVLNGALDQELCELERRLDARRVADETVSGALLALSTWQFLVLLVGLGLLFWLSAEDVQSGQLGLGAFVLVQAYAFRLSLPLGGLVITLRQSAIALKTVSEVMDLAEPRVQGAASAKLAPRLELGVTLEAVTYAHDQGRPAIKDVSVELAPASFVVLAGANGSGKSTLARLLGGVLRPDSGRVLVAGLELCTLGDAARCALALYVPQKIGLFNRTLGENVFYPPAQENRTELAARLQAWGFYPDDRAVDLDLMVGQQGERLSGGQVQKLELARLVGVRAALMVLDETTSALDGPSEDRIIRSLREGSLGATLVLVTHRQGLAAMADQVLYLRQGRLAGADRHDVLLRTDETYRSLWEKDHDRG